MALNTTEKGESHSFWRSACLNELAEEYEDLKSQVVTSSWGGLRRARRYA
jgi:hypothetical protein